jgi:TPR repeat protein
MPGQTKLHLPKCLFKRLRCEIICLFLHPKCNLATCYENGEGTKKNLKKAIYWYQKAVESGFNEAMSNLAMCYEMEQK